MPTGWGGGGNTIMRVPMCVRVARPPNGWSVKVRPPHGTNAEGTGAPVRKGSAGWLRGRDMEAAGRAANNS